MLCLRRSNRAGKSARRFRPSERRPCRQWCRTDRRHANEASGGLATMTVIIDALKAAQRERARRHSSAAPTSAAPILVPLRSRPLSASPTRRMLLLVGGGGALIALSFGARSLLQSPGKPSALPTVPAITSTILAEALADSGARN